MPSDNSELDYERLLKLRLVVARVGEMDRARWWNTLGLLGRYGEIALSRVTLLAAGYAKGRPGAPAIPYATIEGVT